MTTTERAAPTLARARERAMQRVRLEGTLIYVFRVSVGQKTTYTTSYEGRGRVWRAGGRIVGAAAPIGPGGTPRWCPSPDGYRVDWEAPQEEAG